MGVESLLIQNSVSTYKIIQVYISASTCLLDVIYIYTYINDSNKVFSRIGFKFSVYCKETSSAWLLVSLVTTRQRFFRKLMISKL